MENFKQQLGLFVLESIKKIGPFSYTGPINFNHPKELDHGEYSCNVAFLVASDFKITPKILAEKIVEIMNTTPILYPPYNKYIANIESKNGFINFYLSHEFFTESIEEILKKGEDWGKNEILSDKKVMVEYTQPNPFKPFHIGHLMSNAIGESISRIVEFSGAKTIRANYQGDVGPHIAKAIYGLLKFGLPDESESTSLKARYIGECYSKGSNLYDENEEIKKEIDEINKKVYDKSDEKINEIYQWGREITLEAFEEIYDLLGTKFDYYFFESEMAKIGESVVRENVGKIFDKSEESDAIVFHGENYDPKLHTRVFINSQGLPTYETKEIGLTLTKFEKEKDLDISIVTTAIEQAEYMKVVSKAISIMHPLLEKKMKHIAHGMMRFADGKMSSRKGNVITGESLLNDSMNFVLEKMKEREMSEDERKDVSEKVGVAALKYSILKSSLGSDIIYDFEKSISFEGDSGPYLQYTAVRANAILEKSKNFDLGGREETPEDITGLEKLLYQFPEIVEYSYKEFASHHIAVYLTKLASEFNTFYGNTQILVEENKYMSYHLNLVKSFYQTMENGLWLLGIEIPRKM